MRAGALTPGMRPAAVVGSVATMTASRGVGIAVGHVGTARGDRADPLAETHVEAGGELLGDALHAQGRNAGVPATKDFSTTSRKRRDVVSS